MPINQRDNNIACNPNRFAKVLSLLDVATYSLRRSEQMAIRCIVDAASVLTSCTAIRNGEHWINMSYDEGYEDGVREERARWVAKIKSMFETEL